MQTVLKEITTTPGVIGVFLFNSNEGITLNSMPDFFSANELAEIGRVLVKIHATGCLNIDDVHETTVTYEEAVFIVRAAANNIFLIVMFEPSLSQDLLTMSLNMAMQDLKKIAGDQHETKVTTDEISPVPVPDKSNRIMAEELLVKGSGPLREKLVKMEAGLIKVMGPMAKIVFVDSLYQWLNSSQPSTTTLPDLAAIVGAELNEPEKAAAYKTLVAPLFEAT